MSARSAARGAARKRLERLSFHRADSRAQVANSASETRDAERPRLLVSTKNKSHDARGGVGLPVGNRCQPERRPYNPPRPRAVVPRYVAQCGCHALYTWKKGHPSIVTRKQLLCGSWRHHGLCARRNASVAFARIKEALDPLPPEGNIFLVLTKDRNGVYTGKPLTSIDATYADLGKKTTRFIALVRKYCAQRGWPPPVLWIGVAESHRSGWPHFNLILHAPELAAELEAERVAALARGETARNSTLLRGALLGFAMRTGWGVQSTAERARSADALAGYIVKLAGEADATTGEIAKLSQVPTNAPKSFRRLRSSKGALPPTRKDRDYTGVMVQRLANWHRSPYAAMARPSKDPEARVVAERLLEVEEGRMQREYEAKLPLRFNEERTPLPKHETFRLRDTRYELVTSGESTGGSYSGGGSK